MDQEKAKKIILGQGVIYLSIDILIDRKVNMKIIFKAVLVVVVAVSWERIITSESRSVDKHIDNAAGGPGFDSRGGQIGLSGANGSPPLRCPGGKWRRSILPLVTSFGVISREQ